MEIDEAIGSLGNEFLMYGVKIRMLVLIPVLSNNARKDNSICECMPTFGWIVRVTALCSLVLFEDRQSETLWLLPVIPGEFDLYLQ